MNTTIAYCGLECATCPIHLATVEKDLLHQKVMRESIAKQINQIYNTDLQPEDVNDCDGCRSDSGKLFSGCLNCEIRKCASSRNIENCAYCPDYSCDILDKFLEKEPQAKLHLDEIRNHIS